MEAFLKPFIIIQSWRAETATVRKVQVTSNFFLPATLFTDLAMQEAILSNSITQFRMVI
jgi:hypothetical protein